MEERRLRVASFFEWLVAGVCVIALVWLVSVPVQRALGPRVDAALVDVPSGLPPGIPAGATSVPALVLLDGREVRNGILLSRFNSIVPDRFADGPAHVSAGEFGERRTRAYLVEGTRFYVVFERLERGGPMRITGVFLP